MPGTKWREMFMQRNLSHKRVADADAGGLAGRGGGGGDTTKQRSNNDVVGVFDHAVEQRGALFRLNPSTAGGSRSLWGLERCRSIGCLFVECRWVGVCVCAKLLLPQCESVV